MSEIIEKLKDNKKAQGIILLGLIVIGVLVYFLIQQYSTKEVITNDNKQTDLGVADVVSFDNENKEQVSKTNQYRKLRNKSNNIDNNISNAYVFEKKDTVNEANIEDKIKEQTNSLRDKYRQKSARPNVYEDFNRSKSIPTVSSSTPYRAPVQVKQQVVQQVDNTPKKRRKDISFNSGNLSGGSSTSANNSKSVRSYVYNNGRKVKNGSSMKLMLNEPLVVNGITVPKNHIITGKVTFEHERVCVSISSIAINNNIYRTSLTAYDVDGQKGIYNGNIISHEIAQQNIERAIDNGSNKVTIPLLGEVSVDFAKGKLREQAVVVSDGTIVDLQFK